MRTQDLLSAVRTTGSRAHRRRGWAALLAGLPLAACGAPEPAAAPPGTMPPPAVLTRVEEARRYADPFIGSGGFGFRDGSAFPGAAAPHGLAKVGPDTRGPFGTVRFLHFIGYWYGDDVIQGFSHLHLHGTGAPDYGVLSVMPVPSFDPSRLTAEANESRFQKKSESAAPGSYAVTLANGPIRAELTATPRAAHHRYTFEKSPPGTERALLFDLDKHLDGGEITQAEVTVDKAGQRLSGRLHSMGEMTDGYGGYEVYFAARTRAPFAGYKVWSAGSAPEEKDHAQGKGVGVALLFPTGTGAQADAPLELQVAVSLVSAEYARKSLDAELPDWDFERTQQKTAAAWEALLGLARVTGGSERERRMFYSALYRCFLMPTVHSERDGTYLGFDGALQTAQGFDYVSDLSLWDTYRALNPLYSLLAPGRALDVARSLHEMAKARGGAFPKWPLAGGDSGSMIGAPAELVLADAYLKGVTGFDAAGAYELLRAAAMSDTEPAGGRGGRGHAALYMKYGYVPAQVGGSVSWTTEYARGDFALAELAQALGKTQDAAALRERARSYRAVYDRGAGFLRARKADGTFSWSGFSPESYSSDYTEANAWQSLWMNDHDIAGLVELLGGNEALVDKLTLMFESTRSAYEAEDRDNPTLGADRPPYYWHGNEPDIHAPYLFAQVGRPELTQRWVRFVMQTQYSDKPDGLPGNDDGGGLSGWYVFSALGLYPIVGSDRYVLSIPQFPKLELRVGDGTFTIEAVTASGEPASALLATGYVQRVTLDGQVLGKPELRHRDLKPGSTLRFVIGSDPVRWGAP